MLQRLLFRRPRAPGLRIFLLATLFHTLSFVPAKAQGSGLAGYSVTFNNSSGSDAFAIVTSDTLFVIPFSLYSPGSGTYTLESVRLALRQPVNLSGENPAEGGSPNPNGPPIDGGPGHGGTTGLSYGGVSLQVFSTLPSSLSPPSPLVSFSPEDPTAGPGLVGTVHSFYPDSGFSLTAGTTYYLAFTYNDGLMEWDKTTAATYGYDYPGDIPVTDIVGNGTPLVYYTITAGGVTGFYDNVGGFAIMANALTAIPEPATGGALAGAAVLAAALFVRSRRRHSTHPLADSPALR